MEKDTKTWKCKKCGIGIGGHNKYLHDGLCDDCFNKTYFPKDQKAYLRRKEKK